MKYIDSEKLIAEIERRIDLICTTEGIVKRDRLQEYETLRDIEDFIDSLQQEQTDLPSGEDVMTMCNQILIDWVKEGKTQKEKEQREQAHIRFFELYDDYLMREQPEVDLEKEIKNYLATKCAGDDEPSVSEIARHFYELGIIARKEE